MRYYIVVYTLSTLQSMGAKDISIDVYFFC